MRRVDDMVAGGEARRADQGGELGRLAGSRRTGGARERRRRRGRLYQDRRLAGHGHDRRPDGGRSHRHRPGGGTALGSAVADMRLRGNGRFCLSSLEDRRRLQSIRLLWRLAVDLLGRLGNGFDLLRRDLLLGRLLRLDLAHDRGFLRLDLGWRRLLGLNGSLLHRNRLSLRFLDRRFRGGTRRLGRLLRLRRGRGLRLLCCRRRLGLGLFGAHCCSNPLARTRRNAVKNPLGVGTSRPPISPVAISSSEKETAAETVA